MPILIQGSNNYSPHSFENEADLEKLVVDLAPQVFGDSSIYLDVKKGLRGKGVLSIPDAYLIDMADPETPKIYIIENEISTHDPFKHIGVQLLKFCIAYDDAKYGLRKFLMDKIQEKGNDFFLKKVEKICSLSSARNIDNFLDRAVNDGFHALVIIDEARPELHSILDKINADISILELKSFFDGKDYIYETDTLYDEEDSDSISSNKKQSNFNERRNLRAQCDTIVVPAKEEGFHNVFLEKNQWFAIKISAAMKSRIKYIAAYQVAPVSAITHLADIQEIKPYGNTGKYLVVFKNPAQEILKIPLEKGCYIPRGSFYTKLELLKKAKSLSDLL